jgi:thiamine biosynthesis lipoprotein
MVVPMELITVLEAVLEMNRLTDGRFDPTMWPLLQLWRHCEHDQRWPTEAERALALAAIDASKIHVDAVAGTVTRLEAGTQLDLSSAVKGYALDRAMDVMREAPLASVVMNAGGQVLAWDAGGQGTDVGLVDPTDRSQLIGRLKLVNRSVATSSQGESHLDIQGQPVGHLFDVRTGLPVNSAVRSVSVVASSGLLADLLSTAVFVSYQECGLVLLHHFDDVEALLLEQQDEGLVWIMTEQFPSEERDVASVCHCLA